MRPIELYTAEIDIILHNPPKSLSAQSLWDKNMKLIYLHRKCAQWPLTLVDKSCNGRMSVKGSWKNLDLNLHSLFFFEKYMWVPQKKRPRCISSILESDVNLFNNLTNKSIYDTVIVYVLRRAKDRSKHEVVVFVSVVVSPIQCSIKLYCLIIVITSRSFFFIISLLIFFSNR